MLSKGKIRDIEATACYCCKVKTVAFVIRPSQDVVLETVQEQLNIPVASITEVQKLLNR